MSFYLAKANFLQDMLLGMFGGFFCFVFFFQFFLYVIIAVQKVSSRNNLALIYITSLVQLSLNGTQLIDGTISRSSSKVKVMLWCQRNPYLLSSFYQINSKLGVKVAYSLPLS
jgi:hypothetical protein